MMAPSIQKLIIRFSKFPGVGKRTAARFSLYLVKLSRGEFEDFIKSLLETREKIKFCSFCFNPFETSSQSSLCKICRDASRDKSVLAIVEKEADLEALEKIKKYKGLYFILGESADRMREEDLEKMRFRELKKRIENHKEFGLKTPFKEIIIAVSPTVAGRAVRLYLEKILKKSNAKITRLAVGVPIGGELEYTDEETLLLAMEGRR